MNMFKIVPIKSELTVSELEKQYLHAFEEYLSQGGEEPLAIAYEVGRNSFMNGLGVLDVAAIHQNALVEVMGHSLTVEERERITQLAAEFFIESLSPYEMVIRGFRETNEELRQLNENLEQQVLERTQELETAFNDLRSSEEKYRALVENLEDVVFSLDITGNIVFASASIKKYGYSLDEIIGHHFRTVVHPDDLPDVEERFASTLEGYFEPFSFRIRDKKGDVRFVRTAIRALLKDGIPIGMTGVLIDMTDYRRMEEQLQFSQKMESVGRLAGGIAHDFNNILLVILNYADLLLDEAKEGDPIRTSLEEIRRAGERAAALTKQLLAFSRRQIMQPQPINLNEVVSGMESMLRRLLGEDVQLVVRLAPDLGIVKVDPGQMGQVIMNLAVNSRDAMPNGGKLTIETVNLHLDEEYEKSHFDVKPGNYVMLSITDNGCGMSEETKSHIFEPFFTTKEKGKGTGLGLSTVYGIVKQSGGNIGVYSEIGRGTTFKIYLPIVQEPAIEQRAVHPLVRATGSETILVVEDEKAVRDVAVHILKSAGYNVLSATNGGEALLICEKYTDKVHLVIADVVMPQMSGREIVTRLAKIHPEIKILFMSGYTENSIVQHGVLEQGVHFINKPFTSVDLTRKIREVLDSDASSPDFKP